jgi:hypothetical protein
MTFHFARRGVPHLAENELLKVKNTFNSIKIAIPAEAGIQRARAPRPYINIVVIASEAKQSRKP